MPTHEKHYPFPITWNTGAVQNTADVFPGRYFYKDWVNIPGWNRDRRLDRARGVLLPLRKPDNPYWHKQWQAVWAQQSVRFIPFGAKEVQMDYGNWGMMGPVNPSLPTAEHNTLYNRCLAKLPVQMNGTQFNMPLFLAELHKTSEMILSAKDVLLRMMQGKPPHRGQRRINGKDYWKKSGDPVGGASLRPLDIWLEYRYGWRLLLKDIYDGLAAIWDAQRRGFTTRTTVRATSSFKGHTLWTAGTPLTMNSSLIQADIDESWTVDRECKITLVYRDSFGPTVQTLQQFGITNPINLVWELIPYSFVVDWFIPIGDYLSQLDMFVGKTFVGGTVSYSEARWRSFQPVKLRQLATSFQPTIVGHDMPASSLVERYYRRVPLKTFPVAARAWFQPELNLNRVIDAIGLMTQRRLHKT